MNKKLNNSPTPKPTDAWSKTLSWHRAWPALLCALLSSLAFIIVELCNPINKIYTLVIVLGMQLPVFYLQWQRRKRGESSLWLFWSVFTVWFLFIVISLGFIACRDGLL